MSVTSLLKLPDVREQLGRLIPAAPSRITAPLLAPPLTRSYALIGTAFDYAARFELERRYPHVRTEPWVAEAALARLTLYNQSPEIAKAARSLVATARKEIAKYAKTTAPAEEQRASMAAHAIRLAKLDGAYRAGYVDPQMTVAEPDNVSDIVRLLEVLPFDVLAHSTTLWLNPTFGEYSHLVGGADCDLISGNRLIDVKVTKNDALEKDYLLQLVSYAILGRAARTHAQEWPEVEHLGIYFARHAYLWTTPAYEIYSQPNYREVEAWYFERAAREFGTAIPGTARQTRNGWPITPGMTADEIAFLEDDFEETPVKPPKPATVKAAPREKSPTPRAKPARRKR